MSFAIEKIILIFIGILLILMILKPKLFEVDYFYQNYPKKAKKYLKKIGLLAALFLFLIVAFLYFIVFS